MQIKTVVDSLMRQWQEKKQRFSEDDAAAALKKTLTKRQIQHIRVKYFRGGILGVAVDSSPWLYKLNLDKERLLSGLRQGLPYLKQVRFFLEAF
jgi:hypothetical protein